MTTTLPEPLPFDAPPGDPGAVAELVRRVAGAGFCLAALDAALRGPSGRAAGWRGHDADTAEARVATVADLARAVVEALGTAAGRLSRHSDVLGEARARVAALRARQDDDVVTAWARLAALPDPATAMRAGAPAAVAVVADFEASEAARRREHAAILAEVADDAAATGRVLAGCSAVVGGAGRAGDAGRVVAHLAVLLPGWGEAELTGRGRELAANLLFATAEEREALAREAAAYAHLPAFAAALLAELGVEGLRTVLVVLGEGTLPWDSTLAAVTASALAAAGTVDGRLAEVDLVDPSDASTNADVIALGMGAVIATGGLAPATLLAWGRQLLAREHALRDDLIGSRAIDRANAPSDVMEPLDPLRLLAEQLAGADDPGVAAALLAEGAAWERLLARPWDDGGAAFGALVRRAGDEPGAAGDVAVRAGLTALGTGLEDGDPDGWTVDRNTVAAVAPALAGAVAAHVGVAVDVLRPAAGAASLDALRGLGYLTAHPAAAASVETALAGWAHTAAAAAPAAGVLGAYVAVEEYGQRLAYALDEFEQQDDAQRRARLWDWTVGLVAGAPPGPAGIVGDALAGYGAMLLDLDGSWEPRTDTGSVHDRHDAAAAAGLALGHLGPELAAEAAVAGAAGYDRAAERLGVPVPPRPPATHWWAPIVDAVIPGPLDAPGFAHRLRGEMVDEGVFLSPDW